MPNGTGKKIFIAHKGTTFIFYFLSIEFAYYEGQVEDGLMHGTGKLIYKDETIHEGTFKHDRPYGHGTRIKNNNYEISGNFNGFYKVSGPKWTKKFIVKAKNNIVYTAYQYRGSLKQSNSNIDDLKYNEIDGQGEFKWPDGRHYFGEFSNGVMQGYGKLTWTDEYEGKATYKGKFIHKKLKNLGDFIGNLFHGKGSISWSNGNFYKGSFRNGQYDGKGYFEWADRTRTYKGDFKNGLMHGNGWLVTKNGIFKGQFKKGELHGKATAVYKTFKGNEQNLTKGEIQRDDEYIGYFENSKIQGAGWYKYSDGNTLVGYFENGKLVNHGKKIYSDGRVYVGELKNEIENGKGVLNNTIYGVFINGEMTEEVNDCQVSYDDEHAKTFSINMLKKVNSSQDDENEFERRFNKNC